jgi:SAM-dependent methyltransferase
MRWAAAAVALAVCVPAPAGEEIPYVQTPQNVVEAMLKLAGVRATDFVMDLGSGDGRILITAARRHGARGVGFDYVGSLVELASENARRAGVADRVTFVQKDIHEVDFSPATVLAFYLLPDTNVELRPKMLAQLRPGARIVSHDGDMGEWEPDARLVVPAPGKPVGVEQKSTLYLWVVPAQVAGAWRTTVPLEGRATEIDLDLSQQFQFLAGIAAVRGEMIGLERAYVRGPVVFMRFPYNGGTVRFEGRAGGDRIVGRVTTPDGRTHPWRALRTN